MTIHLLAGAGYSKVAFMQGGSQSIAPSAVVRKLKAGLDSCMILKECMKEEGLKNVSGRKGRSMVCGRLKNGIVVDLGDGRGRCARCKRQF